MGFALLLIFTFTDLQISLAIAKKPAWARVLEVVGEIPFTTLTIAACAMLFRFRTRKNLGLNALAAVGSGALFTLLTLMGGFMTYNYLSDNLGDISKLWMILPALLMAAAGSGSHGASPRRAGARRCAMRRWPCCTSSW